MLVAYDGSPEAKRALTEAAALARRGQRVAVLLPAGSIGSRLVTVGGGKKPSEAAPGRGGILAAEGVSAEVIGTVGDPLTRFSPQRRESASWRWAAIDIFSATAWASA